MLAEADISVTRMAMDPNSDDKVFAQFYMHAREDDAKSRAEGRPIFKDVPYVMIMVPGDKDNIIRRPIRQNDKARFPKQWAAFEAGQEQAQEGTPLEQWPMVTRAQVEELKFFGVHTVEALSNMPDTAAQNFMGLNRLRQNAKDFLEAAKSEAPFIELREENNVLKDTVNTLTEQVELMKSEMNEMRKQLHKQE
jgi:hypothetical protein